MINKLQEMFESIGLPYYRQGSFVEGDSIPESFYTFWNTDSPDFMYYDNRPRRSDWVIDVYYYTKDPGTIYSGITNLIEAAKNHGFIASGNGKDIASSIPDVFCRMTTIIYRQFYN